MSSSFEDIKQTLINNDYNWYVVIFENDTWDLRHDTSLGGGLSDEEMEEYGILAIQQCWNGEDLNQGDDDNLGFHEDIELYDLKEIE